MRAIVVGLTLLLCAGAAAAATTRKVPQDYGTIQAAVDDADPGDTILVSKKADGSPYQEWVTTAKSLKFVGKKVVWEGHVPGQGSSRCLTVSDDVKVNDVLVQGFVFRNGSNHVYIYGDGAVVQGCTFRAAYGTSVEIDGDGAVVQKCTFYGNSKAVQISGDGALAQKNSANGHGSGGLYVYGSGASVLKNRCVRNGEGQGVYVSGNLANVSGNTVADAYEGIQISGDDGLVEKNKVSRCDGGDSGIHLDGRGLSVLSNQVAHCRGEGIYVEGGSGSSADANTIEGNKVRWATGNGIYSSGFTAAIRGNSVSHVGSTGIYCTYWTNDSGSVVEKNDVEDAFSNGIYIGGGGHDVVGNQIESVSNNGIYCNGEGYSSANSVQENRVAGFFSYGIYLGASFAPFLVEGNDVSDGMSWSTGIYVYNYYGTGGGVRGNDVSGVGGSGVSVYADNAAPGTDVEGNSVEGSGTNWDYAIYFYGSGASISGNVVSGQNDAGLYVNGPGGNTVDGNSIRDPLRMAMYVTGSGNTVTNNVGIGSGGEGFINGGSSTAFTGNTFLNNRTDVAGSGTYSTPDIAAVNTFETGGVGWPVDIWD